MLRINRSVDYYVKMLEVHSPFTFARYGDGEWRAIIGGKWIGTRNSNGCTMTTSLSNDLRKCIKDWQDYDHGMLNIAIKDRKVEINEWLSANRVAHRRWVKGDVLLTANLSGNFYPFIVAMRKRRVLYVGPQFIRSIPGLGMFTPIDYVIIPGKDTHNVKDDVLRTILNNVSLYSIGVICYSAGLTAKVLIDDVFKINPNLTQIDMGSMWDGYLGQQSRSYIRRGKVLWNDLIAVNSGKRKAIKGETFRR